MKSEKEEICSKNEIRRQDDEAEPQKYFGLMPSVAAKKRNRAALNRS